MQLELMTGIEKLKSLGSYENILEYCRIFFVYLFIFSGGEIPVVIEESLEYNQDLPKEERRDNECIIGHSLSTIQYRILQKLKSRKRHEDIEDPAGVGGQPGVPNKFSVPPPGYPHNFRVPPPGYPHNGNDGHRTNHGQFPSQSGNLRHLFLSEEIRFQFCILKEHHPASALALLHIMAILRTVSTEVPGDTELSMREDPR